MYELPEINLTGHNIKMLNKREGTKRTDQKSISNGSASLNPTNFLLAKIYYEKINWAL